MSTRIFVVLCLLSIPLSPDGRKAAAQDDTSPIHVNVVLVQLSVAVTDRNGNYVSGLGQDNFAIFEDNIPEKTATFEEGNDLPPAAGRNFASDDSLFTPGANARANVAESPESGDSGLRAAGANVFILFDTSNYMYTGFVFAQDAIADFVRSLEGVNKVALYSYSRDLSRVATLTPDRSQVLRGVRSTVAGDDAALYNCLLLTVKDAAPLKGRKAIVVFSNGPDNASVVPPEDVAELAQSTGTIIYMISTRLAQQEPISTAVFERMSKSTGGKAYFAKNWKDEQEAFASIRDDLAHLYALSYYPQANANRGWRNITVRLVGPNTQHYHVRTRTGYRLLQTEAATRDILSAVSSPGSK
jgi:Ca-activated chloride channel family protein